MYGLIATILAVAGLAAAQVDQGDSPPDGFCQDPGVPRNGFRVGNDLSRGGSGVLYICSSGFTLSGTERSMCRLDGTWTTPVPLCVGGADIQPTVTPPCRVENFGSPASGLSRRVGDFVTYDCDFNHRLLGVRNVSCFESSPRLPRCVWIQANPCQFGNGGCEHECLNEGGLPLCKCNPPQVISPDTGSQCEMCPCSCPLKAADVLLVLDEGSIDTGVRRWLFDLVGHLEQELVQEGFGTSLSCGNLFGLVAYGGSQSAQAEKGRIIMSLEGTAMSNWTNFLDVLGNIATEPTTFGRSDGYAAIKYALDHLPRRNGCPSVSTVMVHLTLRDREVLDAQASKALLEQRLRFENVILQSFVQSQFSASGQPALGVYRQPPDTLVGYLPSLSAFYRLQNQSVSLGAGFGSTEEDYVMLTLDTGGGVYNGRFVTAAGSSTRPVAVAIVDDSIRSLRQKRPCQSTDSCESSPCINGGTCSVSGALFQCSCPTPFFGDRCELDVCSNDPCNSQGVCRLAEDGSAVCTCVDGFSGFTCGVRNSDICRVLSCQNGGSCVVARSGVPRCACPAGFTGPRCLRAADSCQPNPCQSGGQCLPTSQAFRCVCPDRYRGNLCERDLCASVTCHNGGGCVVAGQSARCSCRTGFTGPQCLQQIVRDFCASGPCLNSGTCSATSFGFQCDCPLRYQGDRCETDLCRQITFVNEGLCRRVLCQGVSCQNGGACRVVSGQARCDCPAGFTGPQCRQATNPCAVNPCSNGGVCSTATSVGLRCECPVRFGGEFCRTDFCAGVRCQNGGRCEVDQRRVAGCRCPLGFTGSLCQQAVQGCASSPCRNGGTCVDLPNGQVLCRCKSRYYGNTCEGFSTCERAGGCVDVAFVVDESASSRVDQVWIPQMLESLERSLMTSQLGTSASCRNHYGVVGFGRRVPQENARIYSTVSGNNMVSASEAALLARQLTSDDEGRLEDGYEAVDVALRNLDFRSFSSVEKFVVLVTDEDRDVFGAGRRLSRQQIVGRLLQGGFSLYAVVDNRMSTQQNNGQPALGVSWPGAWFTPGNCDVQQASDIGYVANGFADTTVDYATLALEVGGGVFDIQHLQSPIGSQSCALVKSLERAIVADACRVQKLPVRAVMEQTSSPPASESSSVCVDTVLVMDESRNMGSEHRWLPTLVQRVEEELLTRGFGRPGVDVCRNRYAVVGYARSSPNESGHLLRNGRGEDLVTASDFPALANEVSEDFLGRLEDGYEAIQFALDNVNLRQRMSSRMFRSSMILISDEDRDVTTKGATVTNITVLQQLRQLGIALHVIVDQTYTFKGAAAIGIDRRGQRAYLPDASPLDDACRVVAMPGTVARGRGFARTNEHYTALALQLGGSAWNDNLLKNNPSATAQCTFARSVARAAVDAVRQIPNTASMPRCADTVVVVDVSRQTQLEHAWMVQAIPVIDAALRANGHGDGAGTCRNLYGVVLFGQRGSNVNGVILFNTAGSAMVPITGFTRLASQVQADDEGSIEDGYEAVHLALVNMPLREDANVFRQVLLITDEDRDITERGQALSRDGLSTLLSGAGFHVVVDNSMTLAQRPILGACLQPLHGFSAAPDGWFSVATAGVTIERGYAKTNEHYVELATSLKGSAWDVKQLRVPGQHDSANNAMAYCMVQRLDELLSTRDMHRQPLQEPPAEECWFGARCNTCDRLYVGDILGQQVCCAGCSKGYANVTENQGCNCVTKDVGCVDVLVVMDESKNTQVEQRWLPGLVQYLETRLVSRGIGDVQQSRQCPNLYSLVGFGRRNVEAHVFRDARGLDSVSAGDFIVLASTLSADDMGFVEDGYHAIEHGLERTLWRLQQGMSGPPVGRIVILVTDEDWDQTTLSNQISTELMRDALRRSGVSFHAVVDQEIVAGQRSILGLGSEGQGYTSLGRGQYQQVSGAALGRGFARTAEHYSQMTLDLGGSVWNVLKVREEANQQAMTSAIGDLIARSAAQDLQSMLQRRGPQPNLRPPSSASNGRCWVGSQCAMCDDAFKAEFLGQASPQLCCAFCAKGNATVVPVARNQFGLYSCACHVDQVACVDTILFVDTSSIPPDQQQTFINATKHLDAMLRERGIGQERCQNLYSIVPYSRQPGSDSIQRTPLTLLPQALPAESIDQFPARGNMVLDSYSSLLALLSNGTLRATAHSTIPRDLRREVYASQVIIVSDNEFGTDTSSSALDKLTRLGVMLQSFRASDLHFLHRAILGVSAADPGSAAVFAPAFNPQRYGHLKFPLPENLTAATAIGGHAQLALGSGGAVWSLRQAGGDSSRATLDVLRLAFTDMAGKLEARLNRNLQRPLRPAPTSPTPLPSPTPYPDNARHVGVHLVFIIDQSEHSLNVADWLPLMVDRLQTAMRSSRPQVVHHLRLTAVVFAHGASDSTPRLLRLSNGSTLLDAYGFEVALFALGKERVDGIHNGYDALHVALSVIGSQPCFLTDNANSGDVNQSNVNQTNSSDPLCVSQMILLTNNDHQPATARHLSVGKARVLSESLRSNAQVHGILSTTIRTESRRIVDAHGMDSDGRVYSVASNGTLEQSGEGMGTLGEAFGNTNEDYGQLAVSSGGSVWNSEFLLSKEQSSSAAMTKSFVKFLQDRINLEVLRQLFSSASLPPTDPVPVSVPPSYRSSPSSSPAAPTTPPLSSEVAAATTSATTSSPAEIVATSNPTVLTSTTATTDLPSLPPTQSQTQSPSPLPFTTITETPSSAPATSQRPVTETDSSGTGLSGDGPVTTGQDSWSTQGSTLPQTSPGKPLDLPPHHGYSCADVVVVMDEKWSGTANADFQLRGFLERLNSKLCDSGTSSGTSDCSNRFTIVAYGGSRGTELPIRVLETPDRETAVPIGEIGDLTQLLRGNAVDTASAPSLPADSYIAISNAVREAKFRRWTVSDGTVRYAYRLMLFFAAGPRLVLDGSVTRGTVQSLLEEQRVTFHAIVMTQLTVLDVLPLLGVLANATGYIDGQGGAFYVTVPILGPVAADLGDAMVVDYVKLSFGVGGGVWSLGDLIAPRTQQAVAAAMLNVFAKLQGPGLPACPQSPIVALPSTALQPATTALPPTLDPSFQCVDNGNGLCNSIFLPDLIGQQTIEPLPPQTPAPTMASFPRTRNDVARTRATVQPSPLPQTHKTGCNCACSAPGRESRFVTNETSAFDIVVLMDESFGMHREVEYVPRLVALLGRLLRRRGFGARGKCPNLFSVVAFGQRSARASGVRVLLSDAGQSLVEARDFGELWRSVSIDVYSYEEDGYVALSTALRRLPYRRCADVAHVALMVSDEDRDVSGAGAATDRADLRTALQRRGFTMLSLVDNPFFAGQDMESAFGVARLRRVGQRQQHRAYLNPFAESSSTSIASDFAYAFVINDRRVTIGTGNDRTREDYVGLALDSCGSAWDLTIARQAQRELQSQFAAAMTADLVRQATALQRKCRCVRETPTANASSPHVIACRMVEECWERL